MKRSTLLSNLQKWIDFRAAAAILVVTLFCLTYLLLTSMHLTLWATSHRPIYGLKGGYAQELQISNLKELPPITSVIVSTTPQAALSLVQSPDTQEKDDTADPVNAGRSTDNDPSDRGFNIPHISEGNSAHHYRPKLVL